jgi:hypothetical protein
MDQIRLYSQQFFAVRGFQLTGGIYISLTALYQKQQWN